MKKFLFLFLPLLSLWACEYDDTDLKNRLDDLDDKVTELAARVDALNSDVTALEQLVSGKRFISQVTENEDGSTTLTLVTPGGETSTITLRDGEDATAPVIGVKLDSDGKYYWTLDGEFILADGRKLPVTGEDGATPRFKIENGLWHISYDEGTTWTEYGRATGDDATSIFKSVTLSEDGKLVYVTLNDGNDTVLTFEIYAQFGIAFDTSSATLRVGESLSIPFTLTGADERTQIETLPSGGWKAEATRTEGGGTIEVTAPADSSTGKVVVLVNDGGTKTLMRTLTFVAGVLNVSTTSAQATSAGGPVTVGVDTDLEYEVVIPEAAGSWITLAETRSEIRHETLTFNVAASSLSEPREALVTLESGGTVIETILIYQLAYYDPAAMVLKVEAKANSSATYDKTVCLPLFGAVKATVDWGDGTVDAIDANIATAATMRKHTYAETGFYYVTVTGSSEQLNGNLTAAALRPAIVEIIQWGKLGCTKLTNAFLGNTALKTVPEPEAEAFAAVTAADNMFSGCKALVSVPANLLSAATQLTTVASLFNNCAALESIPATFFEKNTKVTSIASLFAKCTKLNAIPEELFATMPEVTNMSGVFSGCTSLESVPAGIFTHQAAAENISSIFNGCTSLASVPAGIFANQTAAESLSSLFNGCTALGEIPVGLFEKQTRATTIYAMFKGCTSLESLPDGLLDAFAQVTNMGSLFSGCSKLGNLPDGLFRNMSSVTTANYLYEGCVGMSEFPSIKNCTALKSVNAMWKDCATLVSAPADYFPDCEPIRNNATSVAYMFQNCKALKNVPADLFANFTGTTIISQMFQNCTALESLPAGLFDGMPNINTAASTFEGCVNFTGESPYTLVAGEKVHLYDRGPENGFVEIADAKAKNCFKNCTQIADRKLIPIAWGGLNDGTKAKPTLRLEMNPVAGAEYYSVAINIKGTELKSGRMGIFTKARFNQFLDEMGGDSVKVCNRNCVGLTSGWINSIHSAEGLSDFSESMDAATDYILVVSGTNVHGTTVATAETRTADFPAGDAAYDRYVGTWTVTSTSSEITGQPLTFQIEIKPHRVNQNFTVSSWGITTWGDSYPFLMNYHADGTLSIPTADYQGMIGGYYVYLKYRFFNQDTNEYLVWTSNDALASGNYNADGTVTIRGMEFTDPNTDKKHTVSGMEYLLYQNKEWFEHADFFKPGYTVSDYTVGPYTLTKTASGVSSAPAGEVSTKVLLPKAAPAKAALQPGVRKAGEIR